MRWLLVIVSVAALITGPMFVVRTPASAQADQPSVTIDYQHFPQDLDGALFAAFRSGLRVGEPAPDGEATRLEDGARVRLSEYWRASRVIID